MTNEIYETLKIDVLEAVFNELQGNLYEFLKENTHGFERHEEFQDFFNSLEYSEYTDTTSWNRSTIDSNGDLVSEASQLYFKLEYGGLYQFIRETIKEEGWEVDSKTMDVLHAEVEDFLIDEYFTSSIEIEHPEIGRLNSNIEKHPPRL